MNNKFTYLAIISALLITSCRPVFRLQTEQHQTYRLDASHSLTDPMVDSLIYPYKLRLDGEMKRVIGMVESTLTREKPESTLGNWVADAIFEECKAYGWLQPDFAVQNYGGIRIPELAKGPLEVGKLFELMPFENYLVLLKIKGEELEPFFQRMIDYGGWPVSAQLRLTSIENRMIEVTIGDERLLPDKIYVVAMPDYIANGGDDCSFFRDKERVETGVLVRDILISHVEKGETSGQSVRATKDGRFRIFP